MTTTSEVLHDERIPLLVLGNRNFHLLFLVDLYHLALADVGNHIVCGRVLVCLHNVLTCGLDAGSIGQIVHVGTPLLARRLAISNQRNLGLVEDVAIVGKENLLLRGQTCLHALGLTSSHRGILFQRTLLGLANGECFHYHGFLGLLRQTVLTHLLEGHNDLEILSTFLSHNRSCLIVCYSRLARLSRVAIVFS